jgi:hypothetical protein
MKIYAAHGGNWLMNESIGPDEVKALLQEACMHIQKGWHAEELGDSTAALTHFQSAYELQKLILPAVEESWDAASQVVHYRSLAYMAIDCGIFSEASEYASKGLACIPPGGFTHPDLVSVAAELEAALSGAKRQTEQVVSTILNSVQFPDNEP